MGFLDTVYNFTSSLYNNVVKAVSSSSQEQRSESLGIVTDFLSLLNKNSGDVVTSAQTFFSDARKKYNALTKLTMLAGDGATAFSDLYGTLTQAKSQASATAGNNVLSQVRSYISGYAERESEAELLLNVSDSNYTMNTRDKMNELCDICLTTIDRADPSGKIAPEKQLYTNALTNWNIPVNKTFATLQGGVNSNDGDYLECVLYPKSNLKNFYWKDHLYSVDVEFPVIIEAGLGAGSGSFSLGARQVSAIDLPISSNADDFKWTYFSGAGGNIVNGFTAICGDVKTDKSIKCSNSSPLVFQFVLAVGDVKSGPGGGTFTKIAGFTGGFMLSGNFFLKCKNFITDVGSDKITYVNDDYDIVTLDDNATFGDVFGKVNRHASHYAEDPNFGAPAQFLQKMGSETLLVSKMLAAAKKFIEGAPNPYEKTEGLRTIVGIALTGATISEANLFESFSLENLLYSDSVYQGVDLKNISQCLSLFRNMVLRMQQSIYTDDRLLDSLIEVFGSAPNSYKISTV